MHSLIRLLDSSRHQKEHVVCGFGVAPKLNTKKTFVKKKLDHDNAQM